MRHRRVAHSATKSRHGRSKRTRVRTTGAGLLGKEAGFSRSPRGAPVFYSLVLLGTLGGVALTLVGINPIRLLVFVAVINGVAAAPFLVLVMLISNDKSIMGEYVNGKRAGVFGWTTTDLMTIASSHSVRIRSRQRPLPIAFRQS